MKANNNNVNIRSFVVKELSLYINIYFNILYKRTINSKIKKVFKRCVLMIAIGLEYIDRKTLITNF